MAETIYTDGVQTLSQVVTNFIRKSKAPRSEYSRFIEFAIWGYMDIRQDGSDEGVKFKKVVPDSINRISFPSDLQDFVGLFVPVNGELVPLDQKDTIIQTTSEVAGVEILDSVDGEGVDVLSAQLPSLSSSGGVNIDGYYTVEWDKRRILINSTTRSELILGYITSGVSTSGETYIPNKLAPFIESYIAYQDVCYQRNVPENIVGRFLNIMNIEKTKVKEHALPPLREIINKILSSYTMLPKR